MTPTDPDRKERLNEAAEDLYSLAAELATWKVREDGMVYSDQPADEYVREARRLVAYITGEPK